MKVEGFGVQGVGGSFQSLKAESLRQKLLFGREKLLFAEGKLLLALLQLDIIE